MGNFGAKRKYQFYSELGKLVESGFGIREAIGVILETRPGAAEKRRLDQAIEGLDTGKSIAASFDQGDLTRMEIGIIEAGERSGKLGGAFEHLADYFELLARARVDAIKAMLYPFVLLNLGLLLAVIPSDVMGQGFNTPGLLGKFLKVYLGTYAAIALGVMLVMWLLKKAPENQAVDRFLNAVPVLGGVRKNLSMARFTKVYHACLLAGISMGETAEMAGEAASSATLRAATLEMQAAVKEGSALGPVMVKERAFPRAFAKSYMSSEQSGMLDKDLKRWGNLFEEKAASGVRMLAVVLPKLGYAIMVAFVFWKLIGFYSGYYKSLEDIGAALGCYLLG